MFNIITVINSSQSSSDAAELADSSPTIDLMSPAVRSPAFSSQESPDASGFRDESPVIDLMSPAPASPSFSGSSSPYLSGQWSPSQIIDLAHSNKGFSHSARSTPDSSGSGSTRSSSLHSSSSSSSFDPYLDMGMCVVVCTVLY